MPLRLTTKDFLIDRLTRSSRGCLDRLSNDILVDLVFIYLEVEDLLSLRRVSKLYYYLTHETSIWKRMLRNIDYPLPPLPPTEKFSYDRLTALEIERLLCRTKSIAVAWEWPTGDCFEEWNFQSHHYVLEMILLPGSHYFVASVCDKQRKNFSIAVFTLDHPYGRAVPLAKSPTKYKAFKLQAKYLTVNGTRGILISYVTRRFKNKKAISPKSGIDLNEFSGDHTIDSDEAVISECSALHISLTSLETLGDPSFIPGSQEFIDHARAQPPPFRLLAIVRTRHLISNTTLDEISGTPYLVVAKDPNTILFKDLENGALSILHCRECPDFANFAHRIMAVRVLPEQHQIMVCRSVALPRHRHPHPITTIEFFTIPLNTNRSTPVEEFLHADDRSYIQSDHCVGIQITDHYTLPAPDRDDSIQQDLCPSVYAPKPISIYGRTVADDGMIRVTFYPKKTEIVYPPTPSTCAHSTSSRSPSPIPSSSSSNDLCASSSSGHCSSEKRSSYVPSIYSSWKNLPKPRRHRYIYNVHYNSFIRFIESPVNETYRILPGAMYSIVYTIPWDAITPNPPVLNMFRYYDIETMERDPLIDHPGLTDEMIQEETKNRRKPLNRFGFEWKMDGLEAIAWDETTGRLLFTQSDDMKIYVLEFAKAPKEDIHGRRLPLEMDRMNDPDSSKWMTSHHIPGDLMSDSDDDDERVAACIAIEPQPAIDFYDPDCAGFDAMQLV